ncbi:putative carboxyvinyl-carboxyphosphonate phosphorylmutase [Tenacibaculum sp. 190130A14a]|uniref:Isocitrate lyase/phosphoenolpyruvate mutase family protein n=1 Tax=Tenacibaculum polynesiense TaxID=3137857 RepID=A0ABP1F0M8_9FLAO
MTRQEKFDHFKNLHQKGNPIMLYNIWSAGSAKAAVNAGASIVATGSKPLALSQGYPDGEVIPFDTFLQTIEQIVSHVNVPVSVDFESGYAGNDDELLAINTEKLLQTGIIGLNFEDKIIGANGLYSIEKQSKRIKIIREVADDLGVPLFINARTDIFFEEKDTSKYYKLMPEAIARAKAYTNAGADGFFTPGLVDLDLIKKLTSTLNIPLNIVKLPTAPINEALINAGVQRISYGPFAYINLMKVFSDNLTKNCVEEKVHIN